MTSLNADGKSIETDGSPAIGGEGKGVRPMELLLAALGSCSTIDIVLILGKQRQKLDDIKVEIEAQREKEGNYSIFKSIHLKFDLFGTIKEEKAKRAIELSMNEYCSVAMALRKTSEISYEFQIHPATI